MKVYYAAAVRSGRNNIKDSIEIVKVLKKLGCQVLSEHIADPKIGILGEKGISSKKIFIRDMNWLKEADCLISEVTVPSTGVGYEMCYALEILKIPTLALYRKTIGKRPTICASGNKHKFLIKHHYRNIEDLENIINKFIKGVNDDKK